MTITIIRIKANGTEQVWMTFDNSIDANRERDILDESGMDYRVEWNCK